MQNNIDSYVKSFYEKIDPKTKAAIFSALIFGILAHGMMLFNKYSFHDDINCLFGVNSTYTLGRWFLGFLAKCSRVFFQSPHYSLPLIKGLASISFITISSVLVIKILRIKYIITSVLISAIMVVFPVWASIFGYMYTAPYYAFALLFSSLGVFFLCKSQKNEKIRFCGAVVLLCCSIGIYQAFIPFTLTLLLFYLIEEVYSDESNRTILMKGAYFAVAVICSVVLYFILTKLFCSIEGCKLSSYQNVSHMGQGDAMVYFERIFRAFRYFWHPKMRNLMYPINIIPIYYVSIGSIAILFLYKLLVLIKNREFIRAAILFFLLMCIPVSVNFIAVMCSFETVHHLMCCAQVMPFILLAWIIEKESFNNALWNKRIYIAGSVILLIVSFVYCRFDNVYYLKYCFTQSQLVNYYNTMITRIKSCKGYKAEYPITFVGNTFGNTSVRSMPEFRCEMAPLGRMLHSYHIFSMGSMMKFWCGYSPTIVKSKPFANLPEVKAMAIYPNDGSIKVINNTVVIKINR